MERIEPHKLDEGQKTSLKTRVITALILAGILLPSIFVGQFFFFGVVVAFSILSAIELVKVTKIDGKIGKLLYIVTIVSILSLVYYIFIKNNIEAHREGADVDVFKVLYINFTEINMSEMIMMLVAAVYFVICFLSEKLTIGNVFYFICMTIVVSLGLQSLMFLRYSPFVEFSKIVGFDISKPVFVYAQSAFLLLYVAIGVFMNDMGAYFVGIFFGKHKMNPRISPKKTWEGFFGGIIISLIFSLTFALCLDAGGYMIHPVLSINRWYWVLLISFLMPVLGCIGDFVFSAIKRHFGVKDFSNIFPGHGGALDRIDSILFASALVSGMIIFVEFLGGV